MPVVYVIHADEDRAFVETRLIRPLPALGFDRWHSSAMFPGSPDALPSIEAAMRQSAAILAVVPKSLSVDQRFGAEVDAAVASAPRIIPVFRGPHTVESASAVVAVLRKYGGVDAQETAQQTGPRSLSIALGRLLPLSRPADASAGIPPRGGAPIGWNEGVFSDLLAASLGRHDDSRSESLVATLARYLSSGPDAYRAQAANADLSVLRKKRQFLLMRNYASAVIASGTTDFTVRRQYAQALIELKAFGEARKTLSALVKDTTAAGHDERFEARGLMGRMLKQQYVDAPRRKNGAKLTQAIDTYRAVFKEDSENVWHGINAASCIVRAHRDGVKAPPRAEARAIARTILSVLAGRLRRARKKRLDVWDYATRVEALVTLGDFKRASKALDEYLVHPDMDAFEVSSTYRQFDEVLQLSKVKDGRALVEKLAKAAERLRSGIIAPVDEKGTRVMLLRVSDADWPGNVPGLVVRSRMGTIVSATGTAETVKALLKDPSVIAIEESRRPGAMECDRSLPFVHVQAAYGVEGATFEEKGAHALVAVIDNGIDVLHQAFLDATGHSRIIGIWDQQDKAGTPPAGFTFGRYHSQAEIAGYVANGTVPPELSRPNDGHGTHVTSIAAGRAAGPFFGGVAPESQILVVISGGDEPTGYSDAHLAALKFIDQKATELGKPVVVNLSQGMNTGAHDGQSALEVAFDMFSEGGRKPGRVVVKSAGNERGNAKKGHARLSVPQGEERELVWKCPPVNAGMRVELWWSAVSQYRFQLKSPNGAVSDWVDEKNPSVSGYFKKRGSYQLQLVKRHIDNGDSVLKIEANNGFSSALDSDWTLVVQAVKVAEPDGIHAWLERSAVSIGFVNGSDDMTLTVPGTSRSVITVGAVDASMPVTVGDFSSLGPTRDQRKKPDLAAPGVQVKAARRDSTSDVIAMNGTSMAAPHVAGAIALLLSKNAGAAQDWPTATQVAKTVCQNTSNYDAKWDPGRGFGVLDVAALLEVF
jgi:subtilisin family serine protease